MDVSYDWLTELVDVPVGPEELADKVSRTGIEVPSVTRRDEGKKKIVIGHIESMKMHPNSDHMHVCMVDTGEDELRQIVCGAPNVAAGQTVIVALPGARIANNEKIKRGKLRGEISDGMICALQEIGFSDSVSPKKYADGIYVFNEAIKPGTDAMAVLGMHDAILDFDITPNRADALGMRGVAWEVGATYGNKPHFDDQPVVETGKPVGDFLQVSVDDPDDAPSYNLRVVTGVHVQESPLWLQRRLWNAGIRPLNNIVDITNYIMLYFGQPMHAFDYDKVGDGTVHVRRAAAGEGLTTLDGTERTLTADDIVISNGTVPIALAGVMGGLNSEITDSTTSIVFESAVFNRTSIRKTAQRYDLRSQASSRFEKGIDESNIITALDTAARMAAELGGGTVASGIATATSVSGAPTVIDITTDQINHVLGTDLDAVTIRGIFDHLGFGVTGDGDQMTVSVPARRWDIFIVPDLIEEVARIYGYDNLPATLPTATMTVGTLTPVQRRLRRNRTLLQGAGMDQAITYSLRGEDQANEFALENNATTKLAWPMTVDHQELRANMLMGLLDAVRYNAARKENDIALYEQGRVFIRANGQHRPDEHNYVAGVLSGNFANKEWNQKAQPVDFYTTKGIVAMLLDDYNLDTPVEYTTDELPSSMHPGQSAYIMLADQRVGLLGRLHPQYEADNNLPETFVFELNLEPLLAAGRADKIVAPAPKFPSMTRDVALLVDITTTSAAVEDVIRAHAGQYLRDVHLFDVYAGPKLPPATRSLAYTLTFRRDDDTLTEDTVEKAMAAVVDALETEVNAKIR